MVAVKGGTFMMGATEDQGDDFKDPKRTAHLVTVGDYYIGKYPVTQNLWKLVMAGTPIAEPSHFKGSDLLPVENVSWDDIVHEFLPRLNALTGKEYRLPTEAEWEYAARGGIKSKGYKFAGGNDIGEVAWYKGNNLMTNPVGIKAPNELGVCDMSGNVCEWVNDWYENYSSEAQTNPKGPSSGSVRVYRGGCWHFVARSCRVSARAGIDPDYRDKYIGFRLAVTQQSSQPQPQPQPQPQAAVAEPEVGAVYEGTVKTIVEFGAFVEYLPGKDGLLHISELDDKRVNKVEDVIRLGEKVRVKVIGFDRMGKVKLSLKAALQNPKQVAVAESKIFDGRDFTDLVVGDMVAVRGGTFMMGATEEQGNDCGDDEKPVHKVTLSDYCIGKYPVTQRLWKRVMVGTPLADPSEFKGDDLPIENVSWNDIVNEFIPRLNAMTGKAYRLPTEAEWEYAARGGNKSRGYKYSGSNTINDIAWYTDNSDSKTHVVGTKLPNELGIYDMCGNVWEWVNDWDEAYGSGAQTNPKGPLSGSTRMGRGGGWDCVAVGCRVSSRDGGNPDFRSFNIGFRLALSP
jgi:formylglycine-generating enzyme required for sulfatase activity